MNKFRNELEIEIAGQKILLRATFDNLAATESELGSLGYLAAKYGRGVEIGTDGRAKVNADVLPSMTSVAKMIYLNQAEKKFSQEEIFQLCLASGLQSSKFMLEYLALCTSGNRYQQEMTEGEKKS